jgi:hypothetical protein
MATFSLLIFAQSSNSVEQIKQENKDIQKDTKERNTDQHAEEKTGIKAMFQVRREWEKKREHEQRELRHEKHDLKKDRHELKEDGQIPILF